MLMRITADSFSGVDKDNLFELLAEYYGLSYVLVQKHVRLKRMERVCNYPAATNEELHWAKNGKLRDFIASYRTNHPRLGLQEAIDMYHCLQS